MGTGVFLLGVKLLGCEANYSPSSSADVKKAPNCILTSSYIFMVWCLIKHRIHLHGMVLGYAQGQFYLYLYTLQS
jgi:hypothetical protein